MAAKVQSEMATRITVDTVEAANSMKSLRQAVTANTNSWKAMETALKSAGDYQAAAKARMEGLNQTIELQKQRIAELKERQEGLDQTTQTGARQFIALEKQISQANKQLASYEAQVKRAANAYEYQQSGLAKLQESYRNIQSSSKAYVDRLNAEHKTASATLSEYKSLGASLKNLKDQYSIQAQMLTKVESESGKTSDAYRKQKQQLDQTATKIAETNDKLKSMQSTVNRLQPTGISRVDNAVVKVKDHASAMSANLKRGFESAKVSIAAASATMVAFGGFMVSGAKQASSLQKTFVEVRNLAVTGGEKTAEVQKKVNQMYADGRKYSIQYGVSQKSIAEGYEELIKRGYTTNQALGSMKSILQASRASGDDFDDTMKVTTATLEQFGMKSNDAATQMRNTAKVANTLAMAADKTSTNFQDIGTAMTYAGQTAKAAGVSLDQTATILGVMSNNGMEASVAGTGLQRVISRLVTPTDTARTALKKYGLSMDDFKTKSGKLKSVPEIFNMINKSVPKADRLTVFNKVFGQTGQNAANIISENTKAIEENQSAVANAYKNKYVSRLANENMKATDNATKQFKESIKAVQIDLGSQLMPTIAKASKSMASALNQKDTQNGIKVLGKAIAGLTDILIDMVTFLGKHTTIFKVFGTALVGAFAIFKTMALANNIRRTVTEFKALLAAIKGMTVVSKIKDATTAMITMVKESRIAGLALKGGLWGAGIALVITGLVELYKHNKKFRDFCNGMAKAALSFGKSVLNFFKKDWKQLALLLVNPIAGGLALLYKHNKSFRNFCNTMVNDAKRAFKDLGKKFSDGWKTIQKATNNGAKNTQKSWNNFTKQTEKSTDNWWKSTKKNFATGWKQLQKETSNGVKFVVKEHDNLATQTEKGMQAMFRGHEKTFKSGYKVIQDQTRTWHDVVTGHWDRLSDDTSKTAQDMSKYHQNLFRDLYNKLNDMTGGRLGDMLKTFQSIFGSIKDAVGNAVGAVHNKFVDLVNGILRPFKTLIDNIKGGINWILDKVGASQIGGGAAISLVSYANGTDDTRNGHPGGFAKVNDGLTAHYREMYRLPNGQVGMFPAKRNMIVPLPKGTSVLDGERSYQLARLMGIIPHYADGIGDFFDSLLSKGKDIADDMLENVEKIMAHPIEFMKSVFHRFVKASSPVKFARQLITSVPEYIATKMKDWVKKQFEVLDNPGGAGVARWRPYIIRAFKQLGVEPAEWKVAKLLKQIQTESGGNPTIPQQISDINSANGTPAFGLLQFIPSTFNTWAVAGHHNMSKGYDQILAAINALQHGGEGGWGNVGMGHGWANGGLISQHGLYEVAENNLPEYVIPTDINKRSRAYQLLGEIVTRFRAEDQASGRIAQNISEKNSDSAALNRKLDAVLSKFDVLLQLSGNQIQAIKDQGTFDTKSFYKKQARDLRMQQLGLGR